MKTPPRSRRSLKKAGGSGPVSRLHVLSLLSDETRLRILTVLRSNELSVAELQECLRLGQSRISMHLGQLRGAGLLLDRREGQRTYYSMGNGVLDGVAPLLEAAFQAAEELPDYEQDLEALQVVLRKRKELAEQYFNTIAGRLSRNYCPGRSWKAVGHLLLELIPPCTIADLGAGEGLLSQMLARRARKVISVDNSPRMVEVGTELAAKNNLNNLEYRLGDMEAPPIRKASVDYALLSQSLHHAANPQKALDACHHILKPGGQVLILDLNEHTFEKARDLYADVWLGFSEADLRQMMRKAGFKDVSVSVVAAEQEAPHFETILATGRR